MASSSPNLQGFKLLKLPFLAQQAVIKHIEPREILDLSFLSKRMKNILKLSKSSLNEGNWFVNSHIHYISLTTSKDRYEGITFRTMKGLDDQPPCCQHPLLFRAGNLAHFCLKCEGNVKKNFKIIENLLGLIMDVFTIHEFKMVTDVQISNFSIFMKYRITALEVKSLELTEDEANFLFNETPLKNWNLAMSELRPSIATRLILRWKSPS